MDYSATKEYLLSKPESKEEQPAGSENTSFKVRHKLFATLGTIEGRAQLNLKCDPEEAIALRTAYEAIVPGHHMNKKHWNTIILNGTVPSEEIQKMIDRSFAIVVKGMVESERRALEESYGEDALYGES